MNGVTSSSRAQRTWPSTPTSRSGWRSCQPRCSRDQRGAARMSSSRNRTSGAAAARQPALRAAETPGAWPRATGGRETGAADRGVGAPGRAPRRRRPRAPRSVPAGTRGASSRRGRARSDAGRPSVGITMLSGGASPAARCYWFAGR